MEATTSSFYKSTSDDGLSFSGEYLKKDVDYTVDSNKLITLNNSPTVGTVILARQMDPTGQIIPITKGSTALFVFSDIATAVTSDLQDGDTLTINGGIVSGDMLGGNKYITVIGQPETQDGENIINLDNGNQIKSLSNNLQLARYTEEVNELISVSGDIIIDLNLGNVFTINLTENINNIAFVNANPSGTKNTSVTLKIKQGDVSAFTVNFSGIKFPGGIVPEISVDLSAIDRFYFTTDDGLNWDGGLIGGNYL